MIWKILGAVLILLLIVGGFFYYQSTKKTEDTTEAEITEVVEPTATPTPEEVAKDAYKIEIQNGSGIAGEAGRAKTLLEDAEFTVESTANADNYDYEKTEIQAGPDVSQTWLDELKSELEKKYSVKSSVGDIGSDAKVDVIVIIGSFDQNGDSMVKEEPTAKPTTAKKEATTTPGNTTNTPTPSPSASPTPSPTSSP